MGKLMYIELRNGIYIISSFLICIILTLIFSNIFFAPKHLNILACGMPSVISSTTLDEGYRTIPDAKNHPEPLTKAKAAKRRKRDRY